MLNKLKLIQKDTDGFILIGNKRLASRRLPQLLHNYTLFSNSKEKILIHNINKKNTLIIELSFVSKKTSYETINLINPITIINKLNLLFFLQTLLLTINFHNIQK